MGDCPKCKTDSFVDEHCTVLFTLMDWKTTIAFMLVVASFGHLIGLPLRDVFACSFITAIPLCIRVLRKGYCERCDIEFTRSSKAPSEHSIRNPRAP